MNPEREPRPEAEPLTPEIREEIGEHAFRLLNGERTVQLEAIDAGITIVAHPDGVGFSIALRGETVPELLRNKDFIIPAKAERGAWEAVPDPKITFRERASMISDELLGRPLLKPQEDMSGPMTREMGAALRDYLRLPFLN